MDTSGYKRLGAISMPTKKFLGGKFYTSESINVGLMKIFGMLLRKKFLKG